MNTVQLTIAVVAMVILFLHGLEGFSREIQRAGQRTLQSWLGRLTNHRLGGFALGAAFTALVQSSSAVTALTVSLVQAGIISFAASLGVLIGANVGTTATAWLVSLELTGMGPAFIVLGTLMGVLPGPLKVAGRSVFYFGFIFFALDLVGDALEPVKDSPRLLEWLALAESPLAGAAIGAVLTALVQSSSVVAGLVILLVQQGALEPEAAVAIIIGANAGTTVTGLLASIPMGLAARRTAQANLLLNLGGVVLFLPFTGPLTAFVTGLAESPGIAVALAHLVFNLGVALVALPLLGPLARWLMPHTPLPADPDQPGPVFSAEETDEYWFQEGCHVLELLNDPEDPAASVARARVPAGETTRWHRLRGTTERYVIESGRGEVSVGRYEPRPVGPGDVVLIPAMAAQRIHNPGPEDLVFLAVCTPRFLPDNYLEIADSDAPGQSG